MSHERFIPVFQQKGTNPVMHELGGLLDDMGVIAYLSISLKHDGKTRMGFDHWVAKGRILLDGEKVIAEELGLKNIDGLVSYDPLKAHKRRGNDPSLHMFDSAAACLQEACSRWSASRFLHGLPEPFDSFLLPDGLVRFELRLGRGGTFYVQIKSPDGSLRHPDHKALELARMPEEGVVFRPRPPRDDALKEDDLELARSDIRIMAREAKLGAARLLRGASVSLFRTDQTPAEYFQDSSRFATRQEAVDDTPEGPRETRGEAA